MTACTGGDTPNENCTADAKLEADRAAADMTACTTNNPVGTKDCERMDCEWKLLNGTYKSPEYPALRKCEWDGCVDCGTYPGDRS